MGHRFLVSLGTLAAVTAVVWLAAVSLAGPTSLGSFVETAEASGEGGQASAANPAASAQPYAPPRTPWGHPDLQGVWTSDGVAGVPIERAKEVLTEEELAKRIPVSSSLARSLFREKSKRISAARCVMKHG